MTKRENYEQRTEKFLLPLMEEHDFELVDVEFVKEAGTWYLRAYIDKEGGITVDDCEVINRELGDWLDQEDFIEDSYILEVSSPGLGQALKERKGFCPEHWQRGGYQAVQSRGKTKGLYRCLGGI